MTWAQETLKKMSVYEKVGQLASALYGWEVYEKKDGKIQLTEKFKEMIQKFGGMGHLYGLLRADPWSGKNFKNGLLAEEKAEAVNLLQNYVKENTRLKIPVLMSEESPHGHQSLDGTVFPVNFTLGNAFEPELYGEVMQCIAREVKLSGGHIGYISTLDVLRDPRWGRAEECISEDPYLISKYNTAAVEAFERENTAIAVKVFCAHGEPQGGHNLGAAPLGERELREIHFPGVESAAKAGADVMMLAYTEIDGVPMHANKYLLDTVLRDEFGYKGVCQADGTAIDRLAFMTDGDLVKASALALKAGVDFGLWDSAYLYLPEALERGYIDESDLDKAVLRVLKLKEKYGLTEWKNADTKALPEYLATKESRKTAYKSVAKSAVLLKNDGALPLKNVKKLAVIGPNANSVYNMLGDYVSEQRDGAVVTVLEGLKNRSENVEIVYETGCSLDGKYYEPELAVKAAEQSDAVIMVLGGSSARDFGSVFDINGAVSIGSSTNFMDCGEGVDSANIKLPGKQTELYQAVKEAGKPIIVVLIHGRPYAIPELIGANAILSVGYCGVEGGNAVADILLGKVNPSGKLAASVPYSAAQLPVYYNRKDLYRQLDYSDMGGDALFEFGYGLSYSEFKYSNLQVSGVLTKKQIENGESFIVSVDVENVSDTDGEEITMLFRKVKASSITARMKELKGFTKTKLRAGEKRTLTFKVSYEELKVWGIGRKYELCDKVEVLVGGNPKNLLVVGLDIQGK